MSMLEYGVIVVISKMRLNQHKVAISTKVHSKHNESKSTSTDGNQLEKKVDKISLGLSVVLFALFNIVYWKYYL